MNTITFSDKKRTTVEQAKEALVNYAIARNELKALLKNLPAEDTINPVSVEYEIQLLKIITVGWSLSYFLIQHPKKKELTEAFWNAIHDVSQRLSAVSSASIGKHIDYFSVLKKRLETYVEALNQNPAVSDPVYIVGPTFAQICGNESNPHVILAGSKIFSLSLSGIKSYLDSIEII